MSKKRRLSELHFKHDDEPPSKCQRTDLIKTVTNPSIKDKVFLLLSGYIRLNKQNKRMIPDILIKLIIVKHYGAMDQWNADKCPIGIQLLQNNIISGHNSDSSNSGFSIFGKDKISKGQYKTWKMKIHSIPDHVQYFVATVGVSATLQSYVVSTVRTSNLGNWRTHQYRNSMRDNIADLSAIIFDDRVGNLVKSGDIISVTLDMCSNKEYGVVSFKINGTEMNQLTMDNLDLQKQYNFFVCLSYVNKDSKGNKDYVLQLLP
eukprot:529154_1